MSDRSELLSRAVHWRQRQLGIDVEFNRDQLEEAGKKYAVGWDESFRLTLPDGEVGMGPRGQLSGKYTGTSNEYWAGYSASHEKRIQLEKLLHSARFKLKDHESVWDVLHTKLFKSDRETVSAHVGGVMPEEVRLRSPWVMKDLPELLEDRSVRAIHLLDDVTGHTTTLDRVAAMKVFDERCDNVEYMDAAEARWKSYQLKVMGDLDKVHEKLEKANEQAKPYLEVREHELNNEFALSLREFALREYAADIDGSRRVVARQDLEGHFPKPTDETGLRQWQLSMELQDHGAIITALSAPRQGMSFQEMLDRGVFQKEARQLKHGLERDFEMVFAKGDELEDRNDPKVREQRSELARSLQSLRKELKAFADLVSLSQKTQMGLDLERRAVLGEVINTGTDLGKHLQEDARIASRLQTMTAELFEVKKNLREASDEKKPEWEQKKEALVEKISDLRKAQVQREKIVVSTKGLSDNLRDRYEHCLKSSKDAHDLSEAMTKFIHDWRTERGLLNVSKADVGVEESEAKREKDLVTKLKGTYQDAKQRMKPLWNKDADPSLTDMPVLTTEQRKEFTDKMHSATKDIFSTVITNFIPGKHISNAITVGQTLKEAKDLHEATETTEDHQSSRIERLEAKFKAKLAKWHIIQNTASVGVGFVPGVGTAACVAMGLVNLMYDWKEGARLEELKQNIRAAEESTAVWRMPSDRIPEPKHKVNGDDELQQLMKKNDRGFTAFTKEGWKKLYDEFHKPEAAEGQHIEGSAQKTGP